MSAALLSRIDTLILDERASARPDTDLLVHLYETRLIVADETDPQVWAEIGRDLDDLDADDGATSSPVVGEGLPLLLWGGLFGGIGGVFWRELFGLAAAAVRAVR